MGTSGRAGEEARRLWPVPGARVKSLLLASRITNPKDLASDSVRPRGAGGVSRRTEKGIHHGEHREHGDTADWLAEQGKNLTWHASPPTRSFPRKRESSLFGSGIHDASRMMAK